jgi:lambda repressor-like predicted transcriptional regulator
MTAKRSRGRPRGSGKLKPPKLRAIPAQLVQALRSGHAEGVPVAQLSRRLGISLSQCHRLLKSPWLRPDALVLPPEVAALSEDDRELYRAATIALMKLGSG